MSSYAERAIAAFERLETENAKLQERIHKLEMEGSDHFYRMAYAEDANRTLEAENAKLQDENARLRSCLSDDAENARMIMGENAKLRELVDILCFCMQIHKRCDDCKLNGAKGELGHDPLLACDGLHEMLKELGIEVD